MPETTDESKRNRRTAKRILAIGLPLVIIAATGIGYAYWTATGSGDGSATAGTVSGLDLSTEAPVSTLSPGGAAVTVNIIATNTNASQLAVTGVDFVAGSLTSDSDACDDVSGVSDADVDVSTTATPAAPIYVLGGGGMAIVGTLSLTLPDTGDDQNDCQGAIFSVDLTSS